MEDDRQLQLLRANAGTKFQEYRYKWTKDIAHSLYEPLRDYSQSCGEGRGKKRNVSGRSKI